MARQLSDIRPGDGSHGGEGVSLVFRGANRRRFLVAKGDEVDETVAEILAAPVAKEDALLEAVRATGGDESVEKAAATLARARQALTDAYAEADPAVRKQMADAMDDLMGNEGDAAANGDLKNARTREETRYEGSDELKAVKKAYDDVCKKDYSAEKRREMAKNGEAMSDGSYPIADRGDLEDAIHAIGRGKNNSHGAIRAHIIRRAKALGATSLLPDDWNVSKEDTVTETAQAVPVRKDDGTWDLSAVPEDQLDAVQKALEAADQAHATETEELRKKADTAEQALAKADALTERIEKADYVAIAKGLDNLSKEDDEFGSLLYEIRKAENAEHLPAGTFEALETVLKAANEAAADAFRTAGRGGHPPAGGATDGEAKLMAAAEEIRKADPTLTKEQSVAKALDQNPDLYDETRE